MNSIAGEGLDILMGTFNGEKYLTEQIASLQAQTHANWKLYIRDDGSSDSTPEMLQQAAQHDDRIVIIKDCLGNLGFNANYQCLLKHSKSQFVMFCDQDDQWTKHKISSTLNCMNTHRAIMGNAPTLVHCDSMIVDDSMEVIANRFIGSRGRLTGLPSVLMANPAQGATIMINRPLVELLVLWSPRLPYDYKAALVAEATGYRVFLPEAMLLYRQHDLNAIGASTHRDIRLPRPKHIFSGTLRLGITAAPEIQKTLLEVRDHWHPEVRHVLRAHMNFAKEGFSLRKLFWFLTRRYGFYRRSDYLYSILHCLGFKVA